MSRSDSSVESESKTRRFRFGVFQLDVLSGELYKHGTRIKLQDQPFQVLAMLLDRPGEVLTREELRKRVWDNDTYVDFDHSLNISINKLRDALGDSAATPRFIETLPRRGYRFIAPVSVENPAPAMVSVLQATAVAPSASSSEALPSRTGQEPRAFAQTLPQAADSAELTGHAGSRHRTGRVIVVAATLVMIAALGGWLWRGYAGGSKNRVMLAVLPFEDLAPDQHDQYLIAGLHDEMIAQLGRLNPERLGVI
ncbi:MAG: winged helix-turn-helix domain-containing protein, partial [Candidatus Sulfotelmatobacter sp.]